MKNHPLILITLSVLILSGTAHATNFNRVSELQTIFSEKDKKDDKKDDKKKKKNKKKDKSEMENEQDTVSYSLGTAIGQNLKQQGLVDINLDQMMQGLQDILEGNETKISPEDAQKIISEYAQELQKKQMEKTKKEGAEFLAKNAEKKGVTVLPSGLQYEVITMGDGPKPTTANTVRTHYHGTLIDGTIFDSSVDRGEPIEFPVTGVIKGWTEALQLMPVGSKWKLYIPYELGYGANPRPGGPIKPYDTLIFEVELISIVK